MATRAKDVGEMVLISTVVSEGRRKRMARGGVLVERADKEAVYNEALRQATEAREKLGVKQL